MTWVEDLFSSSTDLNLWVALDADFLPYANNQLVGTEAGGSQRRLTCKEWMTFCFFGTTISEAIGGGLLTVPHIAFEEAGLGGVLAARHIAGKCTYGTWQCINNIDSRSLPRTDPLLSTTKYSMQFLYTMLVDPDLPLADISTFFNETLHTLLTRSPDNNSTFAPTFYQALLSAIGSTLVPDSILVGPSVALVVDTSTSSSSSALGMGWLGLGFLAANCGQDESACILCSILTQH